MIVLVIAGGFIVYCVGWNIVINRTTKSTFRSRMRGDDGPRR